MTASDTVLEWCRTALCVSASIRCARRNPAIRKPRCRTCDARVAADRSSAAPRRATDAAAEVTTVEVRVLVGDHIGLDVAEGGIGLVLDAVIEGLDDVFLEAPGARRRLEAARACGLVFFRECISRS